MDARFTTPNPARHTFGAGVIFPAALSAVPGYWYLATPYSKYPLGIEAAFRIACVQTGLLMRAGVPVFSPIAHTHPISVHASMDPLDHGVWMPVDFPMMHAARGAVVCMMDGWDTSYGVGVEIKTFRDAGKQVVYMTPGEVPAELRA